jgi:hypothetical protein
MLKTVHSTNFLLISDHLMEWGMKNYSRKFRRMICSVPLFLVLTFICVSQASASTISIDESGTINNWALNPVTSPNNDASSISLTVQSDTQPWYVKVNDALDDNKPESSAGHLAEWNTTSSSYVTNPHVLTNTMNVAASAGSGYSVGSAISLSTTNQNIVTGSVINIPVTIPITVSQQVTYSDMHLTNDHVYKIIVTFSGGFS